MFDRGSIYLAGLYPKKGSEIGKTRPVLIIQSDTLNHIGHTTVVVIPLSTSIISDAYPLRFHVVKRELLEQDSDLLCDQIRAIDVQRLQRDKIATLSDKEMSAIETQIQMILECN